MKASLRHLHYLSLNSRLCLRRDIRRRFIPSLCMKLITNYPLWSLTNVLLLKLLRLLIILKWNVHVQIFTLSVIVVYLRDYCSKVATD